MNGVERRPARRTLADVAVCRSMIRSMSTHCMEEHRYHAWPSRVRFCLRNQKPPTDPQMRHATAVGILYEFPSTDAMPGLHPVWSDNG